MTAVRANFLNSESLVLLPRFRKMSSFTPVDAIAPIHAAHKATFLSHSTRSLEWRKVQLKQLGFLLQSVPRLSHRLLHSPAKSQRVPASFG